VVTTLDHLVLKKPSKTRPLHEGVTWDRGQDKHEFPKLGTVEVLKDRGVIVGVSSGRSGPYEC
jgi:hypothetical protein